ncbi:MAG: acyltransferase [Prevotella sp.]|nr:acyltransferase [Prevotella sp.]
MEQKKKRIEWLDALRGFTMILVIANHVAQQAFTQEPKLSSSLPFLLLFRMPLFFFISGFLAYKAHVVWNLQTLKALSLKKIRVQLIPTVVFFLLYVAMICPSFEDGLMRSLISPTKSGYWFTLVLLYMLLTYYLFSYVESKLLARFKLPNATFIVLLFIVSLCFYETCFLPKHFSWAQGFKGEPSELMSYSSLSMMFFFFPFFLYGNMVRRYWDRAQRILDSRWFYPVLIVVVIFCTLDVLKWHTLRFEWTNLPSTIAKFALLTIVFMYFRYFKDYFTQFTVIGRSLQYIGRRTLDIYVLHFFFIPNVPTIGTFFNTYRHNFVLDLTLSIVIALLITGFCIITSNILRVSPLFKKYLFGRS